MVLVLFIIMCAYPVLGQLLYAKEADFESQRIKMIIHIIRHNLKKNDWTTLLTFGHLPDEFYCQLQNLSRPFAITNLYNEDEYIEDVVPFYANTITISLIDTADYLDTILKLTSSPYWHPLANIILYYHQKDYAMLPKIFFSFWYYRIANAIIVQYDDTEEILMISYYSPYSSEKYKFDNLYGCWTSKKLGITIYKFEEGFSCEEECHNVSLYSKFRANNLGTCIGFNTIKVRYNSSEALDSLPLFEDKSKDFHGFILRAYTTEIDPFLYIEDYGNGSYRLEGRDGNVWNTMAKLMNFTIDVSPSVPDMKKPFNFEVNIKQLFSLAFRKADLYLVPIYLFDYVVVELDFSYPFRDSGVCIMSIKSGFVTALFDPKTLYANQIIILEFFICFLCIWITFSVYNAIERKCLSIDLIGKDFLNAFRSALLIPLHNPPKHQSFRIFLTTSLWGYFLMNFVTQATIVSLLTAARRGKDVDTFDDVIAKGYNIYGMASPDIILPDSEERFNIMNSRLVSVQDPLQCISNFTRDSHRFCLVDCSVGRYLARNKLNEEGQQYLHIATDRMHGHHLSYLLPKHSPMTSRFEKYLSRFREAGLINKWERYRFADIKEEAPIKPLGLNDFKSFSNMYYIYLSVTVITFFFELLVYNFKSIFKYCIKKGKKHQ